VPLDGIEVTGASEFEFARLGVGHVVEGRSIFATLTVEQNLEIAFRKRVPRRERKAALARAYELFPTLSERRSQLAGSMSGGEQRMLSLAWALVVPPLLLVCDELSLGLAPIVIDEVYMALRRIRDEGTSLLIVEQEIVHALKLADRVSILSHGEITFQGVPDDLRAMELGDLAGGLLERPDSSS
jgi:branched-chain amino acid transport system ATP-binding protein